MKFQIHFTDKDLEGKVYNISADQFNPSEDKIDLTTGKIQGIRSGPVFEIISVAFDVKEDQIIIEALHKSDKIDRS